MTEKNETTASTEESKNTKGMVVGKDRIERFQTAFRGEVIQPTDFGYERARKIWNASILLLEPEYQTAGLATHPPVVATALPKGAKIT